MNDQIQNDYMELIQANEGIIHKVISLYVDCEEDKKDLYQEILLQGWKSFQRFEGTSKFSTWLYKVALNTVLNFHKKRKKKAEAELPIPQATTATPPQEDHELLYQIIRSLNEVDRMLITLHLDGYKNKEIAEITGITQNHVNVKIHRIKRQIIEKFNKVYHA